MESLDQTQSQIVAAAIQLFSENPDKKPSITEIAKVAHVHRNTFYHYFETRSEVVFAIFSELFSFPANEMLPFSELVTQFLDIIDEHRLLFVHLANFHETFDVEMLTVFMQGVGKMTFFEALSSAERQLLYYSMVGVLTGWIKNPDRIKKDDVRTFLLRSSAWNTPDEIKKISR